MAEEEDSTASLVLRLVYAAALIGFAIWLWL